METKSPSPKSSSDAAPASSPRPPSSAPSDAAVTSDSATASSDSAPTETPSVEPAPPVAEDMMTGGEAAPIAESIVHEFELRCLKLFAAGDWDSLAARLEEEELDAPAGAASPDIYARLLATYLLQNDVRNSRLLWKRVPETVKAADTELAHLWIVGQRMWSSDFAGVHLALRREWTPRSRPFAEKLAEETRRRAVELVARAYDSIRADNLATFLGEVSADEAKRAAVELGWRVDGGFVFPIKPEKKTKKLASSDMELAQLTDYVSFLENH